MRDTARVRLLLLLLLAAALAIGASGCKSNSKKVTWQGRTYDLGAMPEMGMELAPSLPSGPAPLTVAPYVVQVERSLEKAATLRDRGRRTEAIAELMTAVSAAGNDAELGQALALLLVEDGQLLRAEDEFRRVLRLNAQSDAATFALAALLAQRGALGEARPLLERVAARRPGDTKVLSALAALSLDQGDSKAAIDALKAAAAADPEDHAAKGALGNALGQTGEFGQAAAALAQANKANPGDATTALQLGTALAQSGKHEEAERALTEATRLAPEDPRGWQNLAVLREHQGDPEGAARAYESLLKNVNGADRDGTLRKRIEALRSEGLENTPPVGESGNGEAGRNQP